MQEIVYHTNYKLEDNYWWFVARNNIVNDMIKLRTDLSSYSQILDFGCGTGGFASILNKNYNVIGLDTSETALKYTLKRGISDRFLGELKDFPKDNYDIHAVTALDVIEHIEDDKKITHEIYEMLPKNGWLIATVPAYEWMWSHHDEVHMHYRRYNKKRFNDLLKNAGFKIEYSTYFNTFLFLPAFIKRLLDKIKNEKSEKPIDEVPDSLNKLFLRIFSSEKQFLKNISFPFGLSLLTIAKK